MITFVLYTKDFHFSSVIKKNGGFLLWEQLKNVEMAKELFLKERSEEKLSGLLNTRLLCMIKKQEKEKGKLYMEKQDKK